MKKILLIGSPNVGKSVIFSRLTGVHVMVSNYPGTTVEFSEGYARIDNDEYLVIDVPGTYSFQPTNDAEKVAVKLLQESIESEDDFVVVNIIDSTNLERNLNLTLQLINKRVPMVGVLNFWDERRHRGIKIDVDKLEKILQVPFVPTVGITGEGINKVVKKIKNPRISDYKYHSERKWQEIGSIIEETQTLTHRHHTFLERLEEISIHAYTGIPIAGGVLLIVFFLIRTIGESLIKYVGDPFFNNLWTPVVMSLSNLLGGEGFFHNILIGQLINGSVDYGRSIGLITTGLYVPLAAVLPYVFSFYLILSFLEDFGYLPRISVLLDNVMHKLGIHGHSVIPFMLGFGCNVPGVLSTRIMETKRERFIVATLMSIAVPCMAQLAMIFGLLGVYGSWVMIEFFCILFVIWITVGFIINKIIKGKTPELFMEIPPYRIPYFKGVLKKVWVRVLWFIKEAVPWVLLGVVFINILYVFGVIGFIGKLVRPVVSGLFGLPMDAVAALVVGLLRKDLAVGMLSPLNLTKNQVIIACVILTMYFPCLATFSVFLREFKIINTIKATIIMIFTTLFVGAILNLIL
ncbi:MAG: FeoB small GTPase domain-containing protein [Elusimicrobiota bacterium]